MKNKKVRNIIEAILLTAIAVVMLVSIGPANVFVHGNYCDVVEVSNIDKEDLLGEVDLHQNEYKGEFVPEKANFRGFQLWIVNIPEKAKGGLEVSVYDKKGKLLETQKEKLSNITAKNWYDITFNVKLTPGVHYKYVLKTVNCNQSVILQKINSDYLEKENVDKKSGLLMGYMYARSTFSFAEKVLISGIIAAIWLLCMSRLLLSTDKARWVNRIVQAVLLIILLSWNYMFNTFDAANENFSAFEAFSESLVTGVIEAEQNSVKENDTIGTIDVPLVLSGEKQKDNKYGLGIYTDLLGEHMNHDMVFQSDDNWIDGYSRTKPQLLIANTEIAQTAATVGNSIKFANGESFEIIKQEQADMNLIITLKADKALNAYKYGDLLKARFYDKGGNQIQTKSLASYKSQYGLQGRIFRYIARHITKDQVLEVLNTLCAILTATVFVIIVILLKKKYGILMAACFGITFFLSPWIVNFARNLYWVQFTWFIPMAVGLFCANYMQSKKCRYLSFILLFASVFIKCLCGYEYITDIMLGSIAFLLTDFIVSIIKKKKREFFLYFRTIFIAGCADIAGFIAALCVHAKIRGEGNIVAGLKNIIEFDVQRRTLGGNLNQAGPLEAIKDSFNVSLWEVFSKYFHFDTEIIPGVAGELFPLICIVSFCILMYNYKKKKIDCNEGVLYVVLFFTSTAWFVLGKQHSYCHYHLNYVLWYFGYVQICFYVIVKQIINYFRLERKVRKK